MSDNFTSLHTKNQSPREGLRCSTLTSPALHFLPDHGGHFVISQTCQITTNLRKFVQSFSPLMSSELFFLTNYDWFSKLFSDYPLKIVPPNIFNPPFPTLYSPIPLVTLFKKAMWSTCLFCLLTITPCSSISSTRARILADFFHRLIPRT